MIERSMEYRMGDWSIVEDSQTNSRKPSQVKSDWSIVQDEPSSKQSQPNESLGLSAIKAPFRIAEDLYKGGANLITNAPQNYESAKKGILDAFNVTQPNRMNELRQLSAGLAEQGQGLYNIPHDISNYATNRLNLIPKEFNEKVQSHRMPDMTGEINKKYGEPQDAGEKALRWAAKNSLNLLGIGKAASALNPLNLSYKSIAKDVLNTAEKNKKSYSGKYNNLWKQADKKGYKDLSHIIPTIDINTLKKYSPMKSIARIEDLVKNPTVQNAHNAKSDLLGIKRKLEGKTTLEGGEKKQYKAVNDAIDNIQNNMFKNKKGQIDKKLLDKYNKIQKGYSNEVIPYKHKSINEFRKNELSAKELINALSKGKFAAKRGKYHKAIGFRNMINEHPYISGALGGAGLYSIYNDLMGHKTPEQ
jgi:hypothetical protein